MNLKKLLLIASIFQCSNIALAADENLPIPSKTSLDSEQQQILSLGTKVAQGGVDGLKAEVDFPQYRRHFSMSDLLLFKLNGA